MPDKKSPEFRMMMGDRQANSDGFTYDYGKYKAYKCRNRRKAHIHRCRRKDKHTVKVRELRRINKEEERNDIT